MITDDVLWKQAQELAQIEYEIENGELWDDADKYTKQDWTFSIYKILEAERT